MWLDQAHVEVEVEVGFLPNNFKSCIKPKIQKYI